MDNKMAIERNQISFRPQNFFESFFKFYCYLGSDLYTLKDAIRKNEIILNQKNIKKIIYVGKDNYFIIFKNNDHIERGLLVRNMPTEFEQYVLKGKYPLLRFYKHLIKSFHWFMAPLAMLAIVVLITFLVLNLKKHSDALIMSDLIHETLLCDHECMRKVIDFSYVQLLIKSAGAIYIIFPILFSTFAFFRLKNIYIRRAVIFQGILVFGIGISINLNNNENITSSEEFQKWNDLKSEIGLHDIELLMAPFVEEGNRRKVASEEKDVILKIETNKESLSN